ncbi:MAG: CapA family protein [Muribaculaceae bacterium]|nr:CapA family protein [Muribaculaceae bacterium]
MRHLLLPFIVSLILSACHNGRADNDRSDSSSDSTPDSIALRPTRAETLTLALAGDMMLGTDFPDESRGAYLPVDSGMHLLDDCRDIFRRVDLACGNLEGVLGHAGKPKPCYNPSLCFTFRMPEYLVRPLVDAGFDYMNLANNHAGDFGRDGAKSSLKVLTDNGISAAGLLEEAPYAIVEKNGVKVGFTGFTTLELCPSVNDYADLERIIGEMRPKCDVIVVSMHAGGEGSAYSHVTREKEVYHGWPRGNVHEFAHKAIDLGADIIWGHGPHVLRGAEVYKDRLILYSLGNFCTPMKMGIVGATGQAAIAEVTIDSDGRFRTGQLHSFIQQRGRGPVADKTNASARQIKALSEKDFPESALELTAEGKMNY